MTAMRATFVWGFLVVATLLSWFVTEDTAVVRAGATAVILIAALKINLVVAHFMELGWSPRPYRIAISVWLGVVTAIILGCYWLA